MANPHRGEVEIDIGGRERVLRFDFNAIAELEKRLDMPFSVAFAEENAGIRVIKESLYVGLKSTNPRVTPDLIGRWMEFPKLSDYGEKIGEALRLWIGDDDEAKGENVDRPTESASPATE